MIKKIAVPRFFQAAPIMFNCVVFTVVWRIVCKVYFKAALIGEFYHSLQESSPPTAAFRAIVHIDDKSSHCTEFLFARTPPEFDAINYEVTGLVAFSEKQKRFTAGGFQNASRNKFFLGHHVVVERLDWFYTARSTPTRIVADMDCCFCIKAYANSVWFRVRGSIYCADVFKDLVSPFCFF